MAGRIAAAGHQHESPGASRERARRAGHSAPDRTGDAAQPQEARAPGSSLLDLSNAATQLSQDEEVRSGAPAPAPAAPLAPDSLGFSVSELLPSQPDSQPLQLPSQADIPIPALAAVHFVPPAAPTLIGSPASPGYATLPLQAVPRAPANPGQGPSLLYAQAEAVKHMQAAQKQSQRQGQEFGAAGFDGSPAAAGAAHAQAGPVPGALRQRRPTRRGPMDEMRQLVRILVKVIPHSVGLVSIGEGDGGGNRISEEQIKLYLNGTLGDAPRPEWGVPGGWGAYLSELFTWASGRQISKDEAMRCAKREPGRSWEAIESELTKLGLLTATWPLPLTRVGLEAAQRTPGSQPPIAVLPAKRAAAEHTQAAKRRNIVHDVDAFSECELWHQALRFLQAARRKAGTSEPAAATALAGLRREVQAVVIELCTMAAVAHPLQLLPHALTCLQNGQLQLILQPQVMNVPSSGGEAALARESAPPQAPTVAGLNPVTCLPGAPAPAATAPAQAELPGLSPSQLTLSQCSLGQYLLSQPALGSQAAPLGSQPVGTAPYTPAFLQARGTAGAAPAAEGAALPAAAPAPDAEAWGRDAEAVTHGAPAPGGHAGQAHEVTKPQAVRAVPQLLPAIAAAAAIPAANPAQASSGQAAGAAGGARAVHAKPEHMERGTAAFSGHPTALSAANLFRPTPLKASDGGGGAGRRRAAPGFDSGGGELRSLNPKAAAGAFRRPGRTGSPHVPGLRP